MISLSDNHKIITAGIIIAGKTLPLTEKPQGNSGKTRCHFYEHSTGNFQVVLRLDWDDLDGNRDPILDVDIKKDGKKYKVHRKQWHHTVKTFENSEYVYIWKPKNNELRSLSREISFKLQTTHQQTISGVAHILPADNTVKVSKKQMRRQQQILDKVLGK